MGSFLLPRAPHSVVRPLVPDSGGGWSRPPKTITAKLKSGIAATVGWLVVAVPCYSGFYACSEWLTQEPFATAAECHRALARLEYLDGHRGGPELWCAELERGGWCAMAYDSG
jgi:hypothetical protein